MATDDSKMVYKDLKKKQIKKSDVKKKNCNRIGAHLTMSTECPNTEPLNTLWTGTWYKHSGT